jgi:hypothetical protein
MSNPTPEVIPEKKNKIFEDFIYDVGPRFAPVKKETVATATSIDAFFSEAEIERMKTLSSVNIIMVIDDQQSNIRTKGNSFEFTEDQLKLLQSIKYSDSFLIKTEYQQINEATGKLEDNYSSPHLTVVPETQAEYVMGKDAIKYFLKENSKEARGVGVDPKKLKPAKLFFTVTKDETIENVRLDRPSGYPELDEKMKELIGKAPGRWRSAKNAKGEKVDQELVVSFGLMGC